MDLLCSLRVVYVNLLEPGRNVAQLQQLWRDSSSNRTNRRVLRFLFFRLRFLLALYEVDQDEARFFACAAATRQFIEGLVDSLCC